MTHAPLPRSLRLLLHWCFAALLATGLADLLVNLVQRDTPGWLVSITQANQYWPASWRYNYVHWIYFTYLYEALVIGIIGGLLAYWKTYDRFRHRPSW